MKRMRMIVFHLLLLLIGGIIYCYEHDLYLSKKKCIEDYLNSSYLDYECFYELSHVDYSHWNPGRSFIEIVADDKDGGRFLSISLIKKGPFYTIGSMSEYAIFNNHSFELVMRYRYSQINRMYIVIYRHDERISFIEGELENGDVIYFDQWQGNYSVGILEERNKIDLVRYRAFDVNGNLIEEVFADQIGAYNLIDRIE